MYAKVDRLAFLDALKMLASIPESKPVLPVLSHYLLEVGGGEVRVAATDLAVFESVHVACTKDEDGSVCVPAKLLRDVVEAMPKETVNLNLDDAAMKLKVSSGKRRATLKGIDWQDFPNPTSVTEKFTTEMDPVVLRRALNTTIFSSLHDENRPTLDGIYFEFMGDGRVNTVTADGFRLSVSKETTGLRMPNKQAVLVPSASARALLRAAQKEQADIVVTASENNIKFELEGGDQVYNISLISQLVAGNFPNYTQIIPKSHATSVIINRENFLGAIRLAKLFARDSANVCTFQFDANGLTMTATSTDSGDSTAEVDATINGDHMSISFDVLMVGEVLEALACDSILIQMTSANRPAALYDLDNKDRYEHIIMPMHINQGA